MGRIVDAAMIITTTPITIMIIMTMQVTAIQHMTMQAITMQGMCMGRIADMIIAMITSTTMAIITATSTTEFASDPVGKGLDLDPGGIQPCADMAGHRHRTRRVGMDADRIHPRRHHLA